jgi:YNFM family putative membrane transporter
MTAMSQTSQALDAYKDEATHASGVFLRSLIIAVTAFLSLVDLFATQAILPSLTKHYGGRPAPWGLPPMRARSAC